MIGKETDARAETERGGNNSDLQQRQKQVADSTKKLVEKIESEDAAKNSGKNDKKSDSAEKTDKSKDQDGSSDEKPAGDQKSPDSNDNPPSEEKQGDPSQAEGKPKPGDRHE